MQDTLYSMMVTCSCVHQAAFVCIQFIVSRRAKLGKIQGGGVAEGQPRFDKGGVANFFTFYAIKISLFRVSMLSD